MSSTTGQANLMHSAVFVDELERRGVHQAVLCPGSRSTPLAVALAAHAKIRSWVHIDERSAAYFAFGMARELDAPVALLCTSGTAAANFLPAVVEARLSRIPLVVLTADRPPELRDWGAPQTIDQLRLYGEHVKWFAELPVPAGETAHLRQMRAVAARATATSLHEPRGPVHLNFPFREPLLPDEADSLLRLPAWFGMERAEHLVVDGTGTQAVPGSATVDSLAESLASRSRGLLVCGPSGDSGLAGAAAGLAAVTGYPILADPLSGLRFGAHDRSSVVDSYDVFLRHGAVSEDLRPDLVLQVGAVPTSKPLQQFLARQAGDPYVLIDSGEPRDPLHLATDHLRANPAKALQALADHLSRQVGVPDSSWRDRWLSIDRTTGAAIAEAHMAEPQPFEGSALADIAAALPDGATLVVGNSMPVRDADAFVRGDGRRIRIVGNRGANGIDGVVSSALGSAATGRPTVLVVGDLSFYHDLNGLLAARLFDLHCTIVVLNNNGGGIFSFLPQAELLDTCTFEALFGTPIGLDVSLASRLYGASFARPRDKVDFRHHLKRAIHEPGLSVIEYVTDRTCNVAQHRAVWAAVNRALQDSRASAP